MIRCGTLLDTQPKHKQKYGDRRLAQSLLIVRLPPKEIDDLKKEQFPRFSAKEHPKILDETGNRICRVMVMVMERLHPIFGLTNLDNFKQAIRDIVLGNSRRTNAPHLERFDWEAFFYDICWIGTHYSNGKEIKTDAFEEWDRADKLLVRSKQSVLFGHSDPDLRILFTDFYKPLVSSWMDDMQSMFLAADQARKKFERAKAANPEEDALAFLETLGGHVTWDEFWQIDLKEMMVDWGGLGLVGSDLSSALRT
ncbi:hypothetical protein ACEPAF_8065 [Sanghuangporus sanghuang]